MTFDSIPILVVGGLLFAGLVVLAVVLTRRRTAALAAAGLPQSKRAGTAGLWTTLSGLAVLAIAAAGPLATIPVPRLTGTIVVAVDLSSSMTAADVAPSRLEAAKTAAHDFIEAQPAQVDIGLVAFDRGGFTAVKPSADHEDAAKAVQSLQASGGTDIASAILTALEAITGKPVAIPQDGSTPDIGFWGSATIVLLSDGENFGDDLDAAVALAQAAGVRIETVGVGTTEGANVEIDGVSVHTALDEATLQEIAATTSGSYHPVAESSALAGVASSIGLRFEFQEQQLPLAGALSIAALVLLVIGGALTVARLGRLV